MLIDFKTLELDIDFTVSPAEPETNTPKDVDIISIKHAGINVTRFFLFYDTTDDLYHELIEILKNL